MSDQQDLAASTEAAWAGFRDRLADRLAVLEEGSELVIEVEVGPADDELDGAAPFLLVTGWPGDLLHAEAAASDVLDERFRLGPEAEELLEADGWRAPDPEEPHFVMLHQARSADLVAVRCVAALRAVYAVPHPVFLRADGLERDPRSLRRIPPRAEPGAAGVDGTDGVDAVDGVEEASLVGTHEELQVLVDAAVAELVDVEHDDDGDIAVVAGQSMVFVRVLEDRPAVELFAEVVLDPQRPDRIPVELDILNRTHDFARFHCTPGAIRMSYVLVAWPFAPRQLRVVLRRMLVEVDALAEQLALRLEGRRFLQEPAPQEPPGPPATAEVTRPGVVLSHPGMTGLLELLHLGPVSSPAVAQLFEHDRRAVIAQLVGVRTGVVGCAGHDEEQVLGTLRRGLRYVVDREIPERRARTAPPRRRSEQTALISEDDLGEGTLDLGRSR